MSVETDVVYLQNPGSYYHADCAPGEPDERHTAEEFDAMVPHGLVWCDECYVPLTSTMYDRHWYASGLCVGSPEPPKNAPAGEYEQVRERGRRGEFR